MSVVENQRVSRVFLLALLFSVATMFAAPLGAQQDKQTPPASAQGDKHAPPATSESAAYVGSDACKTCHDDVYKIFEEGPHWKTTLDKRGGASKQGCESCHGPGGDHINDPADRSKIFIFKDATAKKINERCLSCHISSSEHQNFARSAHSQNGVSCLDCHSSHHAKTNEFLLLKTQPQLCFACHLNVKPQFSMPFHHRVNEGLVQCADCHNPHGGFLGKQLRSAATLDSVCFTCHADKQGPFVFEHQPVKTEGCVACHVPHGSPNPHLLRTSNLNILCLQCHTASTFSGAPGTPNFHDQAAQYQACTLCHTAIHGSNFDRHFFK